MDKRLPIQKPQTQEKILNQIAGRIAERRQMYPTKEVHALPSKNQITEPYIAGNYSVTLRESRRRYVRKSTGIRVAEFIETPTRLTRDYLMLVYGHGPDLRGAQGDVIQQVMKRYPILPHYARRCRFDHGFYIDLEHAFFSILLIAGWNLHYHPRKILGMGRPPSDFPFQNHSIARNSLVSLAQPRVLYWCEPKTHRPHPFTTFNPITNESISALIRDVLNAIAADAISCGAVYAHTDGYIAPDEPTARRIQQMIADWGLRCGIKYEGAGKIRNAGNYKVGDEETVNFRKPGQDNDWDAIADVPYKRWLQNNFQHLAGRTE